MRIRAAAGWCAGLALVALPLVSLAAPNPAESSWKDVTVPHAREVEIAATATGHRYRIAVATPPGPVPEHGYPVLYVLDGNAAFPVAALLSRAVASRREVTGHAAPLVVGIGHAGDGDYHSAARRRDYTIGKDPVDGSAREGAAPLFLDFIEHDVKPMIAARYRVDARRQAIFGHSFGGLFVLYALFARPATFTTYLASSPSIWWQEESVLAPLAQRAPRLLSATARVQITVGGLEDDPPTGKRSAEALALLAKRKMIEPARGAAARLRELPDWPDRVVFKEIEGEDHGTVWLPALARGMRFFVEQPAATAPLR